MPRCCPTSAGCNRWGGVCVSGVRWHARRRAPQLVFITPAQTILPFLPSLRHLQLRTLHLDISDDDYEWMAPERLDVTPLAGRLPHLELLTLIFPGVVVEGVGAILSSCRRLGALWVWSSIEPSWQSASLVSLHVCRLAIASAPLHGLSERFPRLNEFEVGGFEFVGEAGDAADDVARNARILAELPVVWAESLWLCRPGEGAADVDSQLHALRPLATCSAAAGVRGLHLSGMRFSSPSVFADLAMVFPFCESLDLSCRWYRGGTPPSVVDDECILCAVSVFRSLRELSFDWIHQGDMGVLLSAFTAFAVSRSGGGGRTLVVFLKDISSVPAFEQLQSSLSKILGVLGFPSAVQLRDMNTR